MAKEFKQIKISPDGATTFQVARNAEILGAVADNENDVVLINYVQDQFGQTGIDIDFRLYIPGDAIDDAELVGYTYLDTVVVIDSTNVLIYYKKG